MQKWRKVYFIFIFIMAIIGGLIGFVMGKSGIGKVKVWANIDTFSLFMLTLLMIMVICVIVDIHRISKSNKQFGTSKFKVMIKTRKRLRNVLIFLILDTILVFGIFLTSPDMHTLPLCFMVLIVTLMQVLHYKAGNGIGENGVLYYGVYYGWNDVKSYEIGDETLLEMNVLGKLFSFKYNNKIKFNFDEKDKDHMEMFLGERL